MKIQYVEIKNMLSFEDARLDFEDSGLVLLEGWNFDDGRANGAGKTAIFNSVCFALYGKVPRDISISEILRDGAKKGYAEVGVLVNADLYTIKRERPNKVSITKNGVIEDMSQSAFESKLMLNYDQFLASMYTAQGTGQKFIAKNDTQKKDFLLQLKDLSEFVACRKEADAAVKNLDKEITDLKNKLNGVTSKIQAYTESLKDPTELQRLVDGEEAIIADFTTKIKEYERVKEPDLSKYHELERSIGTKQHKFTEIRSKKKMLHEEYRKITSEDKPFVERGPDANCPHCNGGLNISGKEVAKANDTTAHKKLHQQRSEEIKRTALEVKKRIDDLDDALSKEPEVVKLAEKLRDKKREDYATYDKAVRAIGEHNGQIQKRRERVIAAQYSIHEHNLILEKIANLEKDVTKYTNDIGSKEIEKELYDSVSAMCSPTGAPAYVTDSIVESFNDAVGTYVDMVWPNATYVLNSYKEKTDGDMVAKFSETLTMNGKDKSIGSLSGGELRALSLAVDFAIVDILSKQFGMPLNPIVMDEPFEGLDTAGREIVISLLERLSTDRQIWVVDHASEAKAMFSKVLRVEKRSGISKIVQDP
jgi:DNA repair exonuclease SbcCD ATPase subunit